MIKYDLSYWERETFFKKLDVAVIGSGIVGLAAAIHLKTQNPGLQVAILERGPLPVGASTRNAGFACFGSMTELIDDLTRMSEDDVRFIMRYPFSMIGADGGVQNGKGMPHPRSYGTNARVLGKYVREEKLISLEEAIRRMSSLAAQKFQLKDRGLLREGYAADIVIFDDGEVIDRATFDNPHQFSTGFRYVLVNGRIVVEDGRHNGTRSGMALKGPAFRAGG